MQLLLTKHITKDNLTQLGKDINVDVIEVIKIEGVNFNTQNIDNKALIFTSLNAVKSFFENKTAEALTKEHSIYCVGEKSEYFLEKRGFQVKQTKKNAEELSLYFKNETKAEDYLHLCSDLALETLGKTFQELERPYHKVIAYSNILTYPFYEKPYDAIAFFSPSGVRSFLKNNSLTGKNIFSIGETTTKELPKQYQEITITSTENTTNDLLNLIRTNASEKK